jgi:hypothetical protein
MGYGLQFAVFCTPVIIIYTVNEVLSMRNEVKELSEALLLTQQHMLKLGEATKKDFEAMDEEISESFHEMAVLIAHKRYDEDD